LAGKLVGIIEIVRQVEVVELVKTRSYIVEVEVVKLVEVRLVVVKLAEVELVEKPAEI
jgi:hypothetical protein